LTDISPLWGVWKNADAAISGKGDIDSFSSPADRAIMVAEFRTWAYRSSLSP
jgi:hypothetical protein